ncbi:hypothetical protein HA464_01610 [Rhizobium leguminosarum bv. trifolii]|jgi:polyferredoxin|uniref:hypothetical protein n=1 Tax=Rhizobium TaxID=379 RepID=UPI00036BD561|nr:MULTISPECIES: hypothetical protein [Rhizobium]QIO42803.1 hypothetical protein HA464_01610 [Rhizobium leguminosarum bv. trifolii]QJS28303.1 hypothetical protein RLTA1_13815 [Rhizobium leguminosarum bv. trifolii TA1]QND19718.1 hypothetical protein HB774_05630 [Rhizobium leguminosarum bv. viciae]MBC2804462.1 hypothetical protein [Rhizobium ruizarguesonis]MBY5365243.1 hypothetical protein [Rhizobium leguminosarum]
MSAVVELAPVDRLLVLAVAILAGATLLVAVEAHAFCSVFCIHRGTMMIETQICSGRS